MKRLSISLAAACCMLSISAWTYFSNPAVTVTKKSTPEKTSGNFQTLYYWYTYPGDTYNDRATVDDESWELWIYYGVIVNTNSSAGTLVSKGYSTNTYPHNSYPSVYLYAHY